MSNQSRPDSAFRALSIGCSIAMGLTFGTSAMAGEKEGKDQATCSTMGAPFGSPGYTECMLQQQQRGDQKMLNFLAEQRMHQELGRPAKEMLERKRARRDRERFCY